MDSPDSKSLTSEIIENEPPRTNGAIQKKRKFKQRLDSRTKRDALTTIMLRKILRRTEDIKDKQTERHHRIRPHGVRKLIKLNDMLLLLLIRGLKLKLL